MKPKNLDSLMVPNDFEQLKIKAPDLLAAAELIARVFPKNSWALTSFMRSKNGSARDGTHAEGQALDVGLLSERRGPLRLKSKGSSVLGWFIPPMAHLARVLRDSQHKGLIFLAENDHFHIGRLSEEKAPSLVVGASAPRIGVYPGDGNRGESQMKYTRLFTPDGYALPFAYYVEKGRIVAVNANK